MHTGDGAFMDSRQDRGPSLQTSAWNREEKNAVVDTFTVACFYSRPHVERPIMRRCSNCLWVLTWQAALTWPRQRTTCGVKIRESCMGQGHGKRKHVRLLMLLLSAIAGRSGRRWRRPGRRWAAGSRGEASMRASAAAKPSSTTTTPAPKPRPSPAQTGGPALFTFHFKYGICAVTLCCTSLLLHK